MALDLGALLEAAGRPDSPLGQLVGAMVSRAQVADPDDRPDDRVAAGGADRARLLADRCRLLATRNRILAEAFGACRCWGMDRHCPRCRGDGVPGWEAPRIDWLAELVLPLLERRPDVFRAWLDAASPAQHEPSPSTIQRGDEP